MEPAGPARVERPARGDPRGRCCRLFAPDRSRRGRHHRPARGAVTSVLIPDANYLRNPEHRELLLSGLRLAAGEEPNPPSRCDPRRRCGGVFATDGGG